MTTQRITLPIYNLGCGGGGSLSIEGALTRVTGVADAYVNPATEMAYIVYDAAQATPEQFAATIDRLGYGPPSISDHSLGNAAPPAMAPPAPRRWEPPRQALVAGVWLALIYILSMIADLVLPNGLQVYRIWEQVLVGVTWNSPWTLVLGAVESFLYGVIGGWILARLFQTDSRNIQHTSKPGV
jgi:cation transport ATPase